MTGLVAISLELAGSSPGLVRIERGRDAVRAPSPPATYNLEPSDPSALPGAQPNLEKTRGAIRDRILATRLLCAAAPRYEGKAMLPSWNCRVTPTPRGA